MAKVTVNAGICGFSAVINAKLNEDECVDLDFKTGCPNFKCLNDEKMEFDPMVCCFGKMKNNEVIEKFDKLCPHPACPIPMAVLKAIEVEAGLALAKDVSVTVEK